MLPDIKLRVVTNLPAAIRSGPGIAVAKTNGVYNFGLDFGSVRQENYVPADEYAVTRQLYWNSVSNSYISIPYTLPTAKVVSLSTTSASVVTGAHSFVVDPGLGWTIGTRVKATDLDDITIFLEGTVTAYDPISGAVTIYVDYAAGSGTISNWSIGIAPEAGVFGPDGADDDAFAIFSGTSGRLLKQLSILDTRNRLGTFDTVAQLEGATIPAVILSVNLTGYTAAGDAPPASYTRVATPGTVKSWHVQSADGAYWQLTVGEVAPEHFGAVGDISVTNDATAVQAAADYAVAFNVPMVLAKRYYCTSSIYIYKPNGSVVIRGNGHFTGLNFAGTTSLRITGSATALPNLGTSVLKDDVQINFASSVAATLSANAVFWIWNSNSASWLANRDAYCRGEMMQASKIDNNTAYIYGSAMDGYTGSGILLYKLNPVQAVLSDFRVSTTGTPGTLCQVDLSSGSRVSNIRVDGNTYTGFSLRRSYDAQITGIVTNNPGYPTGSAYAFSIANCQNVKVFGAGSASTRQSLLIGGYGSADATAEAPSLNVVNRFVSVSGMHLQNTGNDAGDMHGNCEFCEYVDCTMWGGVAVGGQNNRWVNCVIYPIRDASITSGYCASGSEIRGGTLSFINCTFPFGSGDMAAQGVINLTNNFDNSQVLDLYVDVINCEFSGAGSASGYPVQVITVPGSNQKYVSIRIVDPVFKINTMAAALYANATDLTTPVSSNFLIVDNPIYTGSGNPYFIYPGTSIASAPRRESRQAGFVDVTTTAAVIAAASSINFKFRYSKLPTVTASVSKPDGSTASTYGGKAVTAVVYGFSALSIRPAIVSTDLANMTASDTARLHWSAEIRDV